MRRAIFALLAVTLVASSTGCCCLDRLFCWGCQGGGCGGGGCGGSCGYGGGGYYGHEGPGGGGCSSCAQNGGGGGDFDGPVANRSSRGVASRAQQQRAMASSEGQAYTSRRPAQGHPMVHQRRDADGEYEFAAGPPTGAVTYPYYTNRGPRDFLAKNPRSIGP